MAATIEPMAAQIDQQQLAKELVEKARAEGVELVGPVEIEMPRDRDGSSDPVIVRKRQRRASGLSPTGK